MATNRCGERHRRGRWRFSWGCVATAALVLFSAACAQPTGSAGLSATNTDAEWERVRVLLPKQKPGLGHPRRDDRQVLCGILWIMETGSSWQDLPEEEFGPTSTVRGRYRKWLKEGL